MQTGRLQEGTAFHCRPHSGGSLEVSARPLRSGGQCEPALRERQSHGDTFSASLPSPLAQGTNYRGLLADPARTVPFHTGGGKAQRLHVSLGVLGTFHLCPAAASLRQCRVVAPCPDSSGLVPAVFRGTRRSSDLPRTTQPSGGRGVAAGFRAAQVRFCPGQSCFMPRSRVYLAFGSLLDELREQPGRVKAGLPGVAGTARPPVCSGARREVPLRP